MPTLSIEILCVGAKEIDLPKTDLIGLDTTCPPKSDRAPSLWQSHMEKIGGVLVHIFDPDKKGQRHRWAYDIIEEDEWEKFKFTKEVLPTVQNLLRLLIEHSPRGNLYFYSDAQWSNEPVLADAPWSLPSFLTYVETESIPMNMAFLITR